MPPKPAPKKTGAAAPKKAAAANSKPGVTKTASKGNVAKGKTAPAAKKSDTKVAPAPAVKKWTPQDDAARKIQTIVRGFISKRKLNKLKKEKQDYEDLMEKMERDACIAIARQQQREAEEAAQKEMEERKRKAEERKRVKRMLEAAFDGDIDEMKTVLKEVREADDKFNVGHDLVGEAVRQRHINNMIDCEDAHGQTPLSEAASGGHAEAVAYLLDLGADPNSRGQFNRTPIYRAAFAGHMDCVEVLLQHGADPRLYASDGQTPENVASQDSLKQLLAEWDSSQTEKLLEKIEREKEKRREMEKARRQAEADTMDSEMAELQKVYDAHQKTLNSLYCELNKRIEEHDNAPAMGFDKPEITLQIIKDAEDKLEIAKVDFEQTKEKMRKLKMKQREHLKEAMESEGETLPGLQITIQELPEIILRDVGNKVKDSGKWPMIIDTTNRTPTFLRYQDTNYINALSPRDMELNTIRMSLLGALRYGKPLVLDMMEVDMFATVSDIVDKIAPGLMLTIMDKSIQQEEKYLKLVRPEDGPEYLKENFSPMRTQRFLFVILTKNIFPAQELLDSTLVIRVHVPE